MNGKYIVVAVGLVAFFAMACSENTSNKKNDSNHQEQQIIQQYSPKHENISKSQETQLAPKELTKELLSAAREGNINKFLALIPESGVIISIDNFIDTTSGDYVLTPDFDVKRPLFWGIAPSGDSIIMTFEELFNTYLAKDFLSGIESNQPKCLSTAEFNAYQLWQDITLYEYCLNPPTEKKETLNWLAVRFVFYHDTLKSIVLDKWTP